MEELKQIPLSTCNFPTDKSSIVLFIELFLGILFLTLWNVVYFILVPFNWIVYLALLPLSIYGNIYLYLFATASFSSVIFHFIKLLHRPKQGIFHLNTKEGKREFQFYKARYWAAYLPLWIARAAPLPWLDFIVMRMLGSKIGKKVCLYDSWIDIELVTIGDNVMTSLNTVIMSHAVYGDKFIQLETILDRNAITGSQSVVAPGVVLEEGAILAAAATTHIGQRLKANYIHVGTPVRKSFPVEKSMQDLNKKMLQKEQSKIKRKDKKAGAKDTQAGNSQQVNEPQQEEKTKQEDKPLHKDNKQKKEENNSQ